MSAEIKSFWTPRGLTWGFDTTINGVRVRRTRYATKEDAEDVLAQIETPNFDIQIGESARGAMKIGSAGAVAELLVCTDLLRRGFDVYRSVSVNAACDVVAGHSDGRLCRIEVKSAVTRNGATRFKRHRYDRSKHDALALVFLREHRIEYIPPVLEWFELTQETSEFQN